MRICIGNNAMKALSISVRCLTLFREDGSVLEVMPVLSRLERKTSLGLFGGFKVNSLQLQRLPPNDGPWKFLFATALGASSNVLAGRYLTAETDVSKNLLVT